MSSRQTYKDRIIEDNYHLIKTVLDKELPFNYDFYNQIQDIEKEESINIKMLYPNIDFGTPVKGLFDIVLYYEFCLCVYYNGKLCYKKYIHSFPLKIFRYCELFVEKCKVGNSFKLYNNKNKVIWKREKNL